MTLANCACMKELGRTNNKEKLSESKMKYWIRLLETNDLNVLPPIVYHVTKVYLGAFKGRAIAQDVSRRLPTTELRIIAQVRSCGICGGQCDIGADFLRVLRIPLPTVIPPTAPHS
jgi:hypothetical protein